MAYHVDPATNDIVIDSFDKGIGDSPYTGITDERNVNIVSIPGEADINFKTSKISSPAFSGSVTGATGTTITYTGATSIENYVAIYFTSVASRTGISTATPYWLADVTGSTATLYSDYEETSAVSVGGSGSATFVAYQIGVVPSYITGATAGGPQYFAQPTNINSSSYFTFLVDRVGMVWSNFKTTTSGFWTYTGNEVGDVSNVSNASGNGLVYWRVNNGGVGADIATVDYLFVFRNSQIDIFPVAATTYGGGPSIPTVGEWTYGWNPKDGTTDQADYLSTAPGTNNSHMAIVAPDGRVYFCDADDISKFYQTDPTIIFNPFTSDTSTFTYLALPLIPINDVAQCIAPLGSNMLIGGQGNIAYQWDTTSSLTSNNIILPESFVSSMITVNTNTYMFVGNRGRIYVTNGSQAEVWKKLPDFLSNTVEPYYRWGGVCYNKNQLYCSFFLTANAGTAITTMGGVWAIDTGTGAMRLANRLSYGTYAGYATAMIAQLYNPVLGVNAAGQGLFIGWYDGTNFGLDTTISTIYTGGEPYVISDMIPIGTALRPTTSGQVEFKLAMPLLAGESVELQVGSSLGGAFTSAGITQGSNTQTILSGNFPMPIQTQQWILLKAILTGIQSNPSYTRLKELRIIGGVQ